MNITPLDCSRRIHCQPLDPDLMARAKPAFVTRRVDFSLARALATQGVAPRPGDLLLARVTRVGQHKRIERPDGRRAHLFAGDLVLVAYGNRYAPDQFDGVVPDDLRPCALVAAGGIAAIERSRHRQVAAATRLQPLGLLATEEGRVLNLADFALPRVQISSAPAVPVIAVFGTSMNAGKTTALARLTLGLTRAGRRVATAKVTGTGAGGDFWMMQDAGAVSVADFTDLGLASTAGVPLPELESVAAGLVNLSLQSAPDLVLLEVADGLLQAETAALALSPCFRRLIDGVLFAAGDAMGAVAGAARLQAAGHRLLALSGSFTAAPLAIAEVAAGIDVPVLRKTELSDPECASALVDSLGRRADGRDDETATTA